MFWKIWLDPRHLIIHPGKCSGSNTISILPTTRSTTTATFADAIASLASPSDLTIASKNLQMCLLCNYDLKHDLLKSKNLNQETLL